MTSKREIKRRLGQLEGPKEQTVNDFPKILMQNLREEYGHE